MSYLQSYVDVFFSPSTQQYLTENVKVVEWWRVAINNFWKADFWLPAGVTWKDIRTSPSDIWVYPILFSLVILFIRYCCVEPFLLIPLAQKCGLQKKRFVPPATIKSLEAIYVQYKDKVPKNVISQASSETNQSERQVERWLRRRAKVNQRTRYDKFLDCGFKLLSHICFAIMGLSITLPKPWLWETILCWKDFPNHDVPADIWWYYMILLAYYWAITFCELPQPGGKGSDKAQMILHHSLTILLVICSWTCGFVRIGHLILFIHEYSDIALLAAKVCHYAGYDAPTEPLFIAFLVLWFITRCCVLPFWIAYSVFFESQHYIYMPALAMLQSWFVGLLMLTAMWTGLIVRTVKRKLTGGGLHDARSDTEESEINTDNNTHNMNEKQKKKKN